MDSDLQVWMDRGGITAKQFEDAKELGSHYQIINHKLYREKDCMFPARYVKLFIICHFYRKNFKYWDIYV